MCLEKEVGVQDSGCDTVVQQPRCEGPGAEGTTGVLDKLVAAVDTVAGKLGHIEERLVRLEEQKPGMVARAIGQDNIVDSDEPVFTGVSQVISKQRQRKTRQVFSDADITESDMDSKTRKKKKSERKVSHTVTTIPADYSQKLNKYTGQTIVEKRPAPADQMLLNEANLLSQKEIEELSEFTLGPGPQTARATQQWDVQSQPGASRPMEEQKDLMDYLRIEQAQGAVGSQQWGSCETQVPGQTLSISHVQQKSSMEDTWKQDSRIQAIVADRIQQIEQDVKAETTQGKRKRSGRYNVTDSSSNASFRRWPNEGILVGPSRKRVTFDELTQVQFIMGFVKNLNDTIDPLMCKFMVAELYELMKLMESTSWQVVRGAFIGIMHDIEAGEILWTDRQALMQRRINHSHAAALAPQPSRIQGPRVGATTERKLFCKFHKAGTCRETADLHVDPMTGITYYHEASARKK